MPASTHERAATGEVFGRALEQSRQQRERELVEGEEAAKPIPHPPASQAKAEKKRRQAAEKAARRRAEVVWAQLSFLPQHLC